ERVASYGYGIRIRSNLWDGYFSQELPYWQAPVDFSKLDTLEFHVPRFWDVGTPFAQVVPMRQKYIACQESGLAVDDVSHGSEACQVPPDKASWSTSELN